jgi:hypothetical protein
LNCQQQHDNGRKEDKKARNIEMRHLFAERAMSANRFVWAMRDLEEKYENQGCDSSGWQVDIET